MSRPDLVRLGLVLAAAVASGIAFFILNGEPASVPVPAIDPGMAVLVMPDGFALTAEIVSTPDAQALGLGGRESMAEDRGILFVYEAPVVPSFWMKGMRFDLDLVWLDGDRVVGIEREVSKDSFLTLETFSPPEPVTAVLEVNAGFSARHGLETGDRLEIRAP